MDATPKTQKLLLQRNNVGDRSFKRKLRRFSNMSKRSDEENNARWRATCTNAYIYDILQRSTHIDNNRPVLNRLKAQIVRIHSLRMQRLFSDTEEADKLDGEQSTLYHSLQMKRRRAQRTIHCLRDENGQMQTSSCGIAHTITSHVRHI